jgi:two-component system CheB/CheR fusion protein
MRKHGSSSPRLLDAIAMFPPLASSPDPEIEPSVESAAGAFSIVGVGASGGGLEAFTRLLQSLAPDTGMAFVLIQHPGPQHPDGVAALLSRATAMRVTEIRQGTPIVPNNIYVMPQNSQVSLKGDALHLEPRVDRPINHFFSCLAAERGASSIGVLLSGADSDGALGLQAIRAEGGIAIAHPEMPRTGPASGAIDLVLSPEEIAWELQRIGRHPALAASGLESGEESALNRIFGLLRGAVGVDFRGYKRTTILRRISRRMILQREERLESYLGLLESNRAELLCLYSDLLINVTGFFRDAEAFSAFEREILPGLLRGRSPEQPVRVWAPGCSTGEEVYSLAMCLAEAIEKLPNPIPFQVFGTDLSEPAIAIARGATYQEDQVARLTPERRAKFFTRAESGYQIVKSLREACVFARHNLVVDPPFSHLDLISCRNVLIYLGPVLQRHAIATFHYALQPQGTLMLGDSERLLDYPDLFSPADKQHKFYKREAGRGQVSMAISARGFAAELPRGRVFAAPAGPDKTVDADLEETAKRIVLSEFGPAWVVVNADLEIIHARGDTGPYLQLPSGPTALALLKMARPGIRSQLRKLFQKAANDHGAVHEAMLRRKEGGEIRSVQLQVRRLADAYLVVFVTTAKEPRRPSITKQPGRNSKAASAGLERLRQELALTSQRLQSLIDERAASRELSSAYEEIQSSNEELQSINEELETSKEELQSSNDELNAVNEVLENRNQELSGLTNDLTNLLSSAAMPILLLDNDLRIRRATNAAERMLGLQPGDFGRPIGQLRMGLSVDDLEPPARRVLETLEAQELELQDREGRWHCLRIRPYRTADHRIEGAVLVWVDIDQARRAQQTADAARAFAESVIESVHNPLLVLGPDLRVGLANRAFLDQYGVALHDIENRLLGQINGDQWNLPGLDAALERLAGGQAMIEDMEFDQELAGRGLRTILVSARLVQPDGKNQILLVSEDITSHKQAERILLEERARLERSVHHTEAALLRSREQLQALTARLLNTQEEERRRVSRELHDDLSQKIAKLQFDVETLEQQLPAELKDSKDRLLTIRDEVGMLSNDVRRIAYELHPSTLDHLGLSIALRSFIRDIARREALDIRFQVRKAPTHIPGEVASAFYRVAQEALRNVAKHAGKTTVRITLSGRRNCLRLTIQDSGAGFDEQSIAGKGGLGLIGMQERVRLVNGTFSLKSRPGHGVRIAIEAPLGPDEESA